MQLETMDAHQIIAMLEEAQDAGFAHAVFRLLPHETELKPQHFAFFDTAGEAMRYLNGKAPHYQPRGPGLDYDVNYRPVEQLLEEIKQANSFTKQKAMNYNNLETLKEELTKLGFGKGVAEQMQQQMEKGLGVFEVHDRIMGNKGQIDLSLHFRRSGQSENYYFNKFEVRLLNGKPLAEGEQYMIIRPGEQDPAKNEVKRFGKVEDAISFFKAQGGDAVLAAGKDAAHKVELARMEKGNVNYLEKDFARTYKNPGISQTIYVERGKGFSAQEAVNLIQGRAVFKDDLLKLGGESYKAWIKLDMDSQKDRYHNFQTLQYHVPTYGFNLEKLLADFNIKEAGDGKKMQQLVTELEKGNRPLVTVTKDGQDQKLYLETSPRYRQLNFFREDGKPEKREQFLKQPLQEHKQDLNKGAAKAKGQEKGLSV